MSLKAFLNLGVSFGEVSLVDTKKAPAASSKAEPSASAKIRTIYFQQENLGQSLKKFWQEHGTPSELIVSSRFLERIFSSKLGGTVAQITTKGFEDWLNIHQPSLPGHQYGDAFRSEILASQDNIFGITSLINAQGKIEQELNISELELIHAKLKLMKIQRVCINLLNANVNPTHKKQVEKYFLENGYEVFSTSPSSLSAAADVHDQASLWRRNVLNACLWGTFKDLEDDLKKSFETESPPRINYLTSQGSLLLRETTADPQRDPSLSTPANDITQTLFAWAKALTFDEKPILYLGVEHWYFINPAKRTEQWQSPWGPIALEGPEISLLKAQPTQEVTRSPWGGVLPSENELGYEPGPMLFGRSLRFQVFDFLMFHRMKEVAYITEAGKKRFSENIHSLMKNVPEIKNLSPESLCQVIESYTLELIAMDLQKFNHDLTELVAQKKIKTSEILVAGFFAESLFPKLSPMFKNLRLVKNPAIFDTEQITQNFLEGRVQ